MMNSLELLWLSLLLYLAGALLSLLLARRETLAIYASGLASLLGGLAGLFAAAPTLLGGGIITFTTAGPFPFVAFSLRLDPLAAFMLMVISLLVVITALYSLAYVQEYKGRGAWGMGVFMNLFIASMVALVVVDNAFYFIIFFEMMSLASYFLVISDQDDDAISAGLLYFLIAHAGSVLIMIAFFLLYRLSGSLEFAAFRQANPQPIMASVIFLLAFFGFGAKAGMLPLHGWLPRAHPAAPSHASALMSGVMVKIGIFGIIKVGIDLLGASQLWWGVVVLGFGAVSSVLGVLYALAEHDIKRLLAYHTVENIGIILMGVGVGMIGIASHQPVLAALGLLGALYHLLNHAVFKGLLFLGAGAVIYRLHTKDMEKMGGLARMMPYTALAFLVGCMAISALPPFNGFVSEWFTYQSLFTMTKDGGFIIRLAGPIAIVMLAITGALAAMCFVKVYGISFCGLPRTEKAALAREVPWPMTAAMLLLALLCLALGIGATHVAPVIGRIASSLITAPPAPSLQVAQGAVLFPQHSSQAMLSTLYIFFGLLILPLVILLVASFYRGSRLAFRHGGDPWACGYAYEQAMTVSAGGFTQPLRAMFAPLYRLRKTLDPAPMMQRALEYSVSGAGRVEPVWDDKIVAPLIRSIQWLSQRIQWLQQGDFRLYCLYVVAALVTLLIIAAI
ncbi:hydrogenase 4 subunit B [Yersinia enterocolitica]|uniref:hydrogenase 4 subunit B n=1 Tax=Yersinia enterocolitica TaxID=630 RepID=UPI0005E9CF68|nr:hydrogenase 4 subunit B [Yersinia enterocolitica]EKN3486403.1 hydrogenase 4 subunit B [Yersinia enterocolitica]EKN3946939.1 hydrogenase 4 subunit B [Yersinia enterocolitica]EKN4801768.1 hydrogenase 4 subunit B [Yersinia enterocolitica]EKN4849492.1 hydrogenase 4 subunit B [Yersinia enterocolitica]EKN5120123.1 hydrogenase 4 subunit B [Yersinia enterocolitica]